MNTQYLADRFADAGLELEAAHAPFAPNGEIFQMDIRRHNRRNAQSEYFVCWPGSDDNLVVVQGVDRSEHQLVLMVREPSRELLEAVPQWMMKRRDWRALVMQNIANTNADIVVNRGSAFVRRFTAGNKRHMLAGRDERQLFMCRLPRACTTVREAHQALKAPQVKDSRSAIDRAIRQGEWFFLVPSELELEVLKKVWPRRKVSIGSVIPRAGKPHVADELVVSGGKVYVRGAVRHVDHKTIRLHDWRQVVRNNEVDEVRSLFGGTWID